MDDRGKEMSEILVDKLRIRDVIVYRFSKNTRDAVDQYLSLIDDEVQAHIDAGNVDKPMGYVIDVSQSGMFSVNYMRNTASSMVAKREKFPENYIAYVTNNLNDSVLVNMMDAMSKRHLDNTRKLFHIDKLDDAIDWVLGIIS